MADTIAELIAEARRRFESKVEKTDGCWLWRGTRDRGGYGVVCFKGLRTMRGAHRVAYLLAYGSIPDGMFVLHHCDNPPCVRPAHLYPGTASDNMQDLARRHPERIKIRYTKARGEQHGNSRFTQETVQQVRQMASNGVSGRQIARMFNVNPSSIHRIIHHLNWSHVA